MIIIIFVLVCKFLSFSFEIFCEVWEVAVLCFFHKIFAIIAHQLKYVQFLSLYLIFTGNQFCVLQYS